jgi:glucan phosphoethanolaminetransferase (alkaline phosphatase superfamily)
MLAWGIVLVSNIRIYSDGYQIPKGEIFSPFAGIIFCSITIFALGILAFFPLKFIFYAILCWLWGMVNLIDGGSTSGLLMYFLGSTFAFKAGFFKTYREVKMMIFTLFPISAIISQVRIGTEHVILSSLNVLAVALIFGLTFLLFLPDIRKLKKRTIKDSNFAYLPAEHFSEKDLRCLKKVQEGEKYESIAKDEDIGLSTLKNKMKIIYKTLDVYDKTSFMSTYAGYTILLKSTNKTYPETSAHAVHTEEERTFG